MNILKTPSKPFVALLSAVSLLVATHLTAQEAAQGPATGSSSRPAATGSAPATGTTGSTGSASTAGAATATGSAAASNGQFTEDKTKTPFRFTVGVSGGYDSNPNTERGSGGSGSSFYGIDGDISGSFGTNRTTLSLGLSGGYTVFPDRDGDDSDIVGRFSFDFNHRISNRMSFTYSGYLAYEPEPDFARGITNSRRTGDYLYNSNNFALSYNFTPKLSNVFRYSLNYIYYKDAPDDRLEHTFADEIRYLLLPVTTLVGEYRFGIVDYLQAEAGDRSSTSHYILAGIDHKLSGRSGLRLRAGAELRDYDSGVNSTTPYLEFNIDYALGRMTTLTWSNRYSIEESFAGNNYTNSGYRTGLTLNHTFTERLTGDISLFYALNQYEEENMTLDDNESPDGTQGVEDTETVSASVGDFEEDSIDASIGLQYAFSRTFSGFVSYTFTTVTSGDPFREYSRNRGSIGLRASF